MQLQHVSNVNVVNDQLIRISQFDAINLVSISAAIRDNKSLGLNPADDGKVIRVPIPPLTEERRHELVKQAGEKAEEARIALRNIRHDALNSAKQEEKNGEISKDDVKSTELELNNKIDQFNKQIEDLLKAKETEITTV